MASGVSPLDIMMICLSVHDYEIGMASSGWIL